ncbi:MAG: hypothetical protein MR867_04745 [Eubacterium sp.]|nr:hypothetical protein [Eubacterium sp.]MDD7210424.1 hypothetical protein [Lachnospiraceae bacterium]MDY5498008.1 hypothetical protein [Anaerobutyricum sp.]
MYYTIEGKRVLAILYVTGLIAGTLFINLAMKMQIFQLSDFLDYTEYIKMIQNMDLPVFRSYVLFIRLRQLILFFVCLFLFSPYVVFCILDFIVSLFAGILITVMVLKFGWMGVLKGFIFLFPHYIFYVALFVILYIYLFRMSVGERFHPFTIYRTSQRGQTMLKHRIMIICAIFFLFTLGCVTEIYVNPVLLKRFFPGI